MTEVGRVKHFPVSHYFSFLDESLIGDHLYTALISLDVLLGTTSIFCLAAISLERTVAVKYSTAHMNLSQRPVIGAIIATWFIGVILSASMYGVTANIKLSHYIYTASIFTVGYLIPLAVITASYCIIFYKAVHMMKASNENVNTMREIRVAKTISLVIGLFVISWSPFFLVNMVFVFCGACARPKWLVYVSKAMHYGNSAMNFFVYSVRSPDFRNFFKKVLCPQKRKRNNHVSIMLREFNNRREFLQLHTAPLVSTNAHQVDSDSTTKSTPTDDTKWDE